MKKFNNLPGRIAREASDWEADAIQKTLDDPATMKRLHEYNICPICMVGLPVCHCVDRCARCGKEFGQWACQCPGPWRSAFDKETGERLVPPPTPPQAGQGRRR